MKPMVYCAGPYTKPDPAVNTRNAVLIGQQLRDELDIVTIVPHVTHFEHMLSPKPYEYWLRIDLDLMARCDAVFRIPGESSGADAEEAEAIKLGIPVIHSRAQLAEWANQWKENHAG